MPLCVILLNAVFILKHILLQQDQDLHLISCPTVYLFFRRICQDIGKM